MRTTNYITGFPVLCAIDLFSFTGVQKPRKLCFCFVLLALCSLFQCNMTPCDFAPSKCSIRRIARSHKLLITCLNHQYYKRKTGVVGIRVGLYQRHYQQHQQDSHVHRDFGHSKMLYVSSGFLLQKNAKPRYSIYKNTRSETENTHV